jgi:small-conductance mechanosensitive channel
MEDLWTTLSGYVTTERAVSYMQAALLVIVGYFVARIVRSTISKVLSHAATHQKLIFRRFGFYITFGIFVASALVEVGFDVRVLLGTAGILTVAIGFAAQTSASNFISGLFLLGEKPFSIGDIIRIGGTTGEVLAIDLMSVKIRTFDNLYVRVPNEQLVKSEITNLTRFPIRRVDILLSIAYKDDMRKAIEVLNSVAAANELCLTEPEPLFIFSRFGDSGLEFQFSVWSTRENYLALKNSIQIEIKEAFDESGIEIPFPHVSLYTGTATDPFPIGLIGGKIRSEA